MNEEESRSAGKGSRLLGGERDCLGDFRPGKRLLPRGLQMHRQALLFIRHWLIYEEEPLLLLSFKESGSRRRQKCVNEFLRFNFQQKNQIRMLSGFIFDHATSAISFEYSADFCYSSCFIWSVLSLAVAAPLNALVEERKLDIKMDLPSLCLLL